jgi:hypothetical protein
MTYKKLETVAVSGIAATVALYFLGAFLGGRLVRLFHLSADQWETLFTVVKFVVVFLLGVSVGAALSHPA